MDNKRFYSFIIIIYEDDDNFQEQYFNLLQEKEIIWIQHTQDVDDEGNLKKPHYHFILKLKNACTIKSLAKRFSVGENLIEPIKKSFNGSLKYLIHFGREDKYQYSVDDVSSNSDKLLRKFKDLICEDISEVDKVIDIQSFIESYYGFLSISILGKYVQKINKWDAFRRNMTYFKALLDEHNFRFHEENY